MPERIRRLVYVNAFVLVDGESLNDATPPHYVELMEHIAAERGDGTVVLPYPIWREAFMNDADDALARDVYENRLSPQPVRTISDKLELKAFPTLELPRVRSSTAPRTSRCRPASSAGSRASTFASVSAGSSRCRAGTRPSSRTRRCSRRSSSRPPATSVTRPSRRPSVKAKPELVVASCPEPERGEHARGARV